MKLFYKQQLMILFSFFIILGTSNSFAEIDPDQTSCPIVLLKAILKQDYDIARLLLDQYGADPNASLEDCNNLDDIFGSFEGASLVDVALNEIHHYKRLIEIDKSISRIDPLYIGNGRLDRGLYESMNMYRLLVAYGAPYHNPIANPIVCEALYGRACRL